MLRVQAADDACRRVQHSSACLRCQRLPGSRWVLRWRKQARIAKFTASKSAAHTTHPLGAGRLSEYDQHRVFHGVAQLKYVGKLLIAAPPQSVRERHARGAHVADGEACGQCDGCSSSITYDLPPELHSSSWMPVESVTRLHFTRSTGRRSANGRRTAFTWAAPVTVTMGFGARCLSFTARPTHQAVCRSSTPIRCGVCS